MVTLLGLINAVREARGAPPISDDELRTDGLAFIEHYCEADGLAWLGELFDAELARGPDGYELLLWCSCIEEARRVAAVSGCPAHGRNVVLPFAVGALATAYPDWVQSSEDGTILGWLYPVPRPGGTDVWGRHALTDPLECF
jgi:hypothetical protein